MKRWLLLIILSIGQTVLSQNAFQTMMEKSLQDRIAEQTATRTLVPAVSLEKEIDPAEYIVGPGDVLLIRVGGPSGESLEAAVGPEGVLIVPAVGVIPVTNMRLSEVKILVTEKMTAKYVSKEVSVHLLRPRLFRVSVTGAVQNPGFVEVDAMSRAVQAIDLAGGLVKAIQILTKTEQTTLQTPDLEESSLKTSKINPVAAAKLLPGSKRNIIIKRRGGETVRVDLQKYALTGDLSANPYLRDGDVLFIPNEENLIGRVYASGAVKNPDTFEFAPEDCVRDLLELAHGFSTNADSSELELVRFESGGRSTRRIFLTLPADDPAAQEKTLNFPLQPDDRLFVRFIPKFHEVRNVEVTGEVLYPGVYSMEDNQTRLTEIIQRAGGLTHDASLKNAFIQRRAVEDIADPEFERLKKMNVADMTESERDYFKIKSRERIGGMGVDFVALFEKGDKSQDVLLRDRDLIFIPAQERTVKVAGQVINPGLYPYTPNMPLKHYLEEAGGYNWNARKSRIRLIRSKTGEWAKPGDNTIVEVGDTIFIPEKPERDYWELARDLIAVTAQLSTIYLVVRNATN